MAPCASSSGTAISSAAPARTSTPGCSRASGADAGHDVTVLSQEPHPERYDLGGAAAVRPDVGGLLPVFVLDRYEGYDVRRAAGLHAGRARRAGSRRTPPRSARCCPPTSSSRTTSSSAGRSVPPRARRSPSRRTAPSSSTRCGGTRELSAWGAEVLAGGAGDVRRLGRTSAPCCRSVRPHRPT